MLTCIFGYCVLCYGAAALFMTTEILGFHRPVTLHEAACLATALALAPVTVPAAIMFALIVSEENL